MDFEFEMMPESYRERSENRQREREEVREWANKPTFADTSMSRSSGPELIPKKAPSAAELGMEADMLLETLLLAYVDVDLVHTMMWTMAIQNAFEKGDYTKDIPGFRTASYGFFDPETEMDGFGVIAYVAPSLYGPPRGDFQWVTVSDQNFSVIVRPAEWKLHMPAVDPALGTSTCWAESRRPRLKNKPAILTAKHVVGKMPIGSSVPLTSGRGTLLDLAPEGIDAALVQIQKSHWPANPTKLNCQRFIPPWTDVEVFSPTGRFSTKVIEVSSSRGSLDPNIPVRVYLANRGQSGDSGALVRDNAGNGIGLYMGELTTPANLQEGFCQHLGQVEESMAVDLFL